MPPIKKIIRDVIDAHHAHHDHARSGKEDIKCAIKSMVGNVKLARAVGSEDKEARRSAILDAAERLFNVSHTLANVSAVADAAGLAKGTVYLYFETKEEIYFALHVRQVEHFFAALIERLADERPFTYSEMAALSDEHMVDNRNYMPLCATCMGFGAAGISPEIGASFQERLGTWIVTAGAGLERHFPKMDKGEGVRLLKHSYALLIGLHHLLGERGPAHVAPKRMSLPGIGSYHHETDIALSRYWESVTREPAVRNRTPALRDGEPTSRDKK
jgi:AcrR family transcriptional regulator